MNKYPLIGVSICAVVLLILGSLTNVVGYQSVQSNMVFNSPLFTTRTQRATNQQQNILTSQYLGMGKGNELKVFIPSSNNERILLQKALNKLQGMDDATFTKFLEHVLLWLSTQDTYKDVNVPQLIFTLHQIKENPKTFERYLVNDNNDLTMNGDFTTDIWFPGCLILTKIIETLVFAIFFVWVLISIRLNTCVWYYTCSPIECW